jgi:alkylhydroperoxidase family enzyme
LFARQNFTVLTMSRTPETTAKANGFARKFRSRFHPRERAAAKASWSTRVISVPRRAALRLANELSAMVSVLQMTEANRAMQGCCPRGTRITQRFGLRVNGPNLLQSISYITVEQRHDPGRSNAASFVLDGTVKLLSFLTTGLDKLAGASLTENRMPARIRPLDQPFPPELQARFDAAMRGKPPLLLFTTIARDARLSEKFFSSSLLDRGHLTLRQREVVIGRVTALCRSEYEWGVHIAIFGGKVGLDDNQVRSLVHGSAQDDCWSADEKALLNMCEELHRDCTLGDATWNELRSHFSEEAMLELLMLAGFYRTVSYLTNALQLPLEPFAARFPDGARKP